jgi:ABC-type transporter Mla subunit MlaD
MMFALVHVGNALGQDNLQKYFNDTACKVKATADPSQKRAILNDGLQNMSKALNRVESLRLVSKDDRAGIDRFKVTLEERQNELAGSNGYDRVPDEQLNAFSDFVVQDMEQADRTITISLITLLLIIIIVILVT